MTKQQLKYYNVKNYKGREVVMLSSFVRVTLQCRNILFSTIPLPSNGAPTKLSWVTFTALHSTFLYTYRFVALYRIFNCESVHTSIKTKGTQQLFLSYKSYLNCIYGVDLCLWLVCEHDLKAARARPYASQSALQQTCIDA